MKRWNEMCNECKIEEYIRINLDKTISLVYCSSIYVQSITKEIFRKRNKIIVEMLRRKTKLSNRCL